MITNEKICYIFGAGEFEPVELELKENDYVIAADGGLDHLKSINVEPNMLLGDFDSVKTKITGYKNVIKHPAEKDYTDLMLAVVEGFNLGYKTFVIYGAMGGRLDHTLSNIQTLAYISTHGGRGYLVGQGKVITSITNGKIEFDDKKRGYISVFSNTESSKGVTEKNLKYLLNDYELKSNLARAVSNEFIGKPSEISVKDGTLIILWYEDNFKL